MARKQSHVPGPQFVRYFGPILDALRTLGGSGAPSEVVEQVSRDLNVSDDVQTALLPSGTPRFPNQVAWARFYLAREGFLDASKRGVWSLTEKGRSVVLSPDQAHALFLKWSRIFAEERKRRQEEQPEPEEAAPSDASAAAGGYRDELLALLLALPPDGFERLSQRLLRESGFVQVVVSGRSGDGGIDGYGTLQVNPLVSFKVLFQCKRYAKSVSASQVRDFRGAMQGRADKGIILTTGTFTSDARREASRDGVPPIELVDGEKLVNMFVDLELGLKPVTAYQIDAAFFDEFQHRNGA
jgi:restriction system protein